jgi:integrase
MSKRTVYKRYLFSYRIGALRSVRFGIEMPDGEGGKLRKQGFKSETLAIEWAELAADRKRVLSDDSEMTFLQFAYLALLKEREIKPATKLRYEGILKIYFSSFFAEKKLLSINLSIARAFRAHIIAIDNISDEYKRMIFNLFKTVMRDATDSGIEVDQCVFRVRNPKTGKRTAKAWKEDERLRFFAHPKTQTSEFFDLWKFASVTGLRAGEIAALLWSDVRKSGEFTVLDVAKSKCQKTGLISVGTKNGDSRIVALSTECIELLNLMSLEKPSKHSSDAIFDQLDQKHLSRLLKRDCRRAGVTEIRFHDLRHTYATQELRQGCQKELLMKLLGHRDAKTTDRYLHLKEEVVLSMYGDYQKNRQQNRQS